jgi:LacI family transcriptional regulator
MPCLKTRDAAMTRPKLAAKPTILDVAQRAAVSVGTVSHVLNDRANVSDGRRNRILEAIADLGYVPNGLAQGLRRRESRVVGLCAPLTSSAYFAALLEAFEDIAAQEGYELMQVLSRGEPELELRRVQALLARKVDGLLLIPSVDPRGAFDAIATSGVPVVVVDRASNDRRFDYVTIDDRGAMREATRHLVRLGHRSLLYVVRDPRLVTTRRRIQGFREAVARAKAAIDAEVCQRASDEEEFARQIDAALHRRGAPTAIIASNSDIALSLLRVLKRLSVRNPQDVSVLAFDEPVWADVLTPTLACVRHPTALIASRAWELLLHRMHGGRGAPRRVALAAAMVPGDSIGPPPARRLRGRGIAPGGRSQ